MVNAKQEAQGHLCKVATTRIFFLMELDFALLKYTIKYFLVYSQSCATITIMRFQNIFINPPQKKETSGSALLPSLAPDNQ